MLDKFSSEKRNVSHCTLSIPYVECLLRNRSSPRAVPASPNKNSISRVMWGNDRKPESVSSFGEGCNFIRRFPSPDTVFAQTSVPLASKLQIQIHLSTRNSALRASSEFSDSRLQCDDHHELILNLYSKYCKAAGILKLYRT